MAQTVLLIARWQQVKKKLKHKWLLYLILVKATDSLLLPLAYFTFCVCLFVSVCAGKQVIHPGQIQAVQEEFSPSPERVQWATELIAAFDQHQKEGKVTILNNFKKYLVKNNGCIIFPENVEDTQARVQRCFKYPSIF